MLKNNQRYEKYGQMKVVYVTDKSGRNKFIRFRRQLYKENPIYVDNNLFMLKEVFARRTCFIDNKKILVINIEEDGEVLCQGILVYAKDLKDRYTVLWLYDMYF